ncbi:MAG: hypothetical protein LUD29_04560 [Clostridia bacterium]|nr:hypothetical protein [Clostridia bacterium]
MIIAETIQKGRKYLQLVEPVRVKEQNGTIGLNYKVVYNIGYLSDFEDGKPYYLRRLRRSFKEGHPLIPALNAFCSKDEYVTLSLKIDKDYYSEAEALFGKMDIEVADALERFLKSCVDDCFIPENVRNPE